MVTIVHSSRGDSVVKDVQLTDKVKRFVMHDGIVYTSDMKTLVAGLPLRRKLSFRRYGKLREYVLSL